MEGFPVAKQKPFTAEIPIRIPVNEPAPTTQAKQSKSFKVNPALVKSLSTSGIKVTECRMEQSGICEKYSCPSFTATTVKYSFAVSIAKKFFKALSLFSFRLFS